MTDNKIRNLINELKVDAILITDPYNIRYMSGFSGGEGYMFVTPEKKILYVDSRYTLWAKNESRGCDVVETGKEAYKELNDFAKKANINKIAVEGNHLKYNEFKEIKNKLAGYNLIPIDTELDNLRMIKSEEEIELIAKAERIGDEAFSYILNEIKPGVTEKEIALKLEFYMRSHGAERLSFEVIAASGLNSASPHAMPSDKIIEEGDFLTLDFGCVYNGYCSDMTRTIVVGKANERQKEIYNIVKEAQQAALDNIKAGMTGKEADSIARNIIASYGYADQFGHGLGHGIGLFIHEMPRLSVKGDIVLEPGMVVSVEPGIYIEGFGGVRIEDAVVIEENGVRNLTKSTKELVEIKL